MRLTGRLERYMKTMEFYKLFRKRTNYDRMKIFMWKCMHPEVEDKQEYYKNKVRELMMFPQLINSKLQSEILRLQ